MQFKGINVLNRKFEWGVIIPILLLTGIFIYFFYVRYNRIEKWSNPYMEKRYTIGNITKYRHAGKSPPWFKYKFEFKGSMYEGEYSIVSKIRKLPRNIRESFEGQRYYVKFIVEDPDYSKLLMAHPVPDSIREVPENGWDSIP